MPLLKLRLKLVNTSVNNSTNNQINILLSSLQARATNYENVAGTITILNGLQKIS